MNCTKLKELDLLYIYHELAEDEQTAVKDHLASCPECRERIAGLKQTLQAARQLATPSPSDTVMAAIQQAAVREFKPAGIRQSTATRVFRFPSLSLPRLASLAAAALILLAVGIGLFRYQGKQEEIAAKYEWDNGIEEEILALQDELEVLEWEIFEAGDIAEIDRQIMDLNNSLDEDLEPYAIF